MVVAIIKAELVWDNCYSIRVKSRRMKSLKQLQDPAWKQVEPGVQAFNLGCGR